MPKANTTAAQAAQAAVAEEVAHADHVTADHVTTHVPAAVAAATMNGAPAKSETHIGVRCNESSRGERVLLMPRQRERGGREGGGKGRTGGEMGGDPKPWDLGEQRE